MKTDRELLELAAKAAGIEVLFQTLRDGSGSYRAINITGLPDAFNINAAPLWNPLADDGDALRLAVKLNFVMDLMDSCAVVSSYNNEFSMVKEIQEHEGKDPYAATRRAIVRAAAAIGESL